jgi:cation:H+ antiporter
MFTALIIAAGLAIGITLINAGLYRLHETLTELEKSRLWPAHTKTLLQTILSTLPEISLGLLAAWNGQSETALAIVWGSCLVRLFGLLPLATLVQPLLFNKNLVVRDLPLLIIVSAVCMLFTLDGKLSLFEGFGFAVFLVLYLVMQNRRANDEEEKVDGSSSLSPLAGPLTALGFISLGLGAYLTWNYINPLSRYVPLPWLGLTVLAISPRYVELKNVLQATRNGQMDLAAGQLIRSSTLLLLLGLSCLTLYAPLPVASGLDFLASAWDLWAVLMSGFVVLVLVGFKAPRTLNRFKAGMMGALYLAYLLWRLVS